MTTIKKSNAKNGSVRGILTPIAFVALLGLGLASCQSESVAPQQKASTSTSEKTTNTFADEDEDNALKPPKEPDAGGGN